MTAPKKLRLAGRIIILTFVISFVLPPPLWADKDDAPPRQPTSHPTEEGPTVGDAATGSEQVKLSPEAVRKYGVRTGVATKRTLVSHVQAPARLAFNAEMTAVVGVAVQGRVLEVKVRVGDHVNKGDDLLVVESPELGEGQSDLLQKRTAVLTAESSIAPAQSAYDRAKSLFDQSQGISLTELQRREVELTAAKNALLTSHAAAAAAENRLLLLGMDDAAIKELVTNSHINPKYVVRSPLTGTVIERTVNLGELVNPEREKLLVISDMSTIWALATVPEAKLQEVAEKAKVTVTVMAAGGREFNGVVSRISPSIDETTRSAELRVELAGDAALKPGMFAQADIISEVKSDDGKVLAVPEAAIQTVNGSTAVFLPVRGEENTFILRLVSIDRGAGGFVSIISGLEDGEHIVTAGTAILKADLLKSTAKDED